MTIKKYKTLIFLLLIISCSKSKKIDHQDILNIDFPESIIKGEIAKGRIKYNLSLDLIKNNDIKDRYIFLYLTKVDTISKLEKVKKYPHKIFVEDKTRGTIEFEIKFESLGNKTINFFLEDKIFYRKSNIKDSIFIKTKEINFTKGVLVEEYKKTKKDYMGDVVK